MEGQTMSQAKKGALYMLACAIMWSTGGLFIKLVPWNSFVISGVRSLIAGAVILGFMTLRKISIRVNKRTVIAGLVTMLSYFSYVLANKLTTAANAVVLQFTSPIFIMLASVLILHQKVRGMDIGAVLLTLGGIALFFLEDLGGGGMLGNSMAIFMGMSMAGMYMIVGTSDAAERFSCVLFGQLFTFLLAIPFFFLYPPTFTPTATWAIVGLGVIQIGVPYLFYVMASMYCPPFACCLLSAIEPVLNPLWVFLALHEQPGPMALLGGVIVVVAVTGWSILDERAKQRALHAASLSGTN
jgi:drug/metabolite transporter (DMT)-like permease